MALLAPALIVGVVLMHSLSVEPANTEHLGSTTEVTMSSMGHDSHGLAEGATAPDTGSGGEHGSEGGLSDCGGLMAMCLALLVSLVALIGSRQGASRWVLWQRPPPTFIRIGTARTAFHPMTALQRTAVIRC